MDVECCHGFRGTELKAWGQPVRLPAVGISGLKVTGGTRVGLFSPRKKYFQNVFQQRRSRSRSLWKAKVKNVLLHPFKAVVSNSIYLGAAGGRVWVRLGRIRYSTKKALLKKKTIFSNVIINSSLTWMGSSEHERFFWTWTVLNMNGTLKNMNGFFWTWPLLRLPLFLKLSVLVTNLSLHCRLWKRHDIYSFHLVSLRNKVVPAVFVLLCNYTTKPLWNVSLLASSPADCPSPGAIYPAVIGRFVQLGLAQQRDLPHTTRQTAIHIKLAGRGRLVSSVGRAGAHVTRLGPDRGGPGSNPAFGPFRIHSLSPPFPRLYPLSCQ